MNLIVFDNKKLNFFFLIFFLFLILYSCTTDDEDNTNVLKADVTITFLPNPVQYDYYDENINMLYWEKYTMLVKEHAGVGATLIEWCTEVYTRNNQFLTILINSQNFSLGPYGEFVMTFKVGWTYPQPPIVAGWYMIEKMKFKDKGNHEFEVTGEVSFLEIPEYNISQSE